MIFKNEATLESCELWMKYPFNNNHYLKEERLYSFIYHLCKYEDRIDDEKTFLKLCDSKDSQRSKEECKDAFQKYIVIQDFYTFLKKIKE